MHPLLLTVLVAGRFWKVESEKSNSAAELSFPLKRNAVSLRLLTQNVFLKKTAMV